MDLKQPDPNMGTQPAPRGLATGFVGKQIRPWMIIAIFLIVVVAGGTLLLSLITGHGPLQKFGLNGQYSSAGWDKHGRAFENDVPVSADYDGDGKVDIAVWRQSNNTWYVKKSSGGSDLVLAWGSADKPDYDTPVPADYDGDGKADIAVWRWGNGTWYIKKTKDQANLVVPWGSGKDEHNDTPVPADYDGDGKADMAVWRQTTGTWYILKSSKGFSAATPGGYIAVTWGSTKPEYRDIPVPADYDGDGKADMAVWRQTTGTWYILKSSKGFSAATPGGYDTVAWGKAAAPENDVPVPADYDGDGKADIAVWRANGVWYVKESSGGEVSADAFGSPLTPYFDVPVPADYDGDGKTDRSVWRKSNAVWYVKQSSDGKSSLVPWGIPQTPGPVPPPTLTPPPGPVSPPGKDPALSHIKYFGEFDNAIDGIGTGNYIDEVKTHSNTVWVNGDYSSKLQQVCSNPNLKAVVSPFWQFFNGNTLRLRSDYVARWDQLKTQLLPYRSCIAAFYLFDEPYFNTRSKGIPDSDTKRSLEQLIVLIKGAFPDAKQWVIFAAPEVDEQLMIPDGMDAIGMDCYTGIEDCMGHSLDWYYSILKSKMVSDQKLILVPGAYYWHTDSSPATSDQEVIISRAEWYKNYAKNNTEVVAVVPYLWQSFYAGVGMRDMPLVRDYFVSWGKQITGK